jgi:hypothetical protein
MSIEMTDLADILGEHALVRLDDDVIIHGGPATTYAELDCAASRYGTGLNSPGA